VLLMSKHARIAFILEHGFAEKLYFVSIKDPRPCDEEDNGVMPQRARWTPPPGSEASRIG
jgi:hypothetical protein